ncbi:MAG: holo-ACP synthase [Anaerolineae bacterium]|nr:holo-ACP synthase [Anaerolineae bacterium]
MLTTGVDIVEIARVESILARHGARFLTRIFTPQEIVYSRGRPAELAARFAAKEAVAKALGVGLRMLSPVGIYWHDAEILNDRLGKPVLLLRGQAQALAREQGLTEWSVSLSHDGGVAIAFVVAVGFPLQSETTQSARA